MHLIRVTCRSNIIGSSCGGRSNSSTSSTCRDSGCVFIWLVPELEISCVAFARFRVAIFFVWPGCAFNMAVTRMATKSNLAEVPNAVRINCPRCPCHYSTMQRLSMHFHEKHGYDLADDEHYDEMKNAMKLVHATRTVVMQQSEIASVRPGRHTGEFQCIVCDQW